MADPRRRLDDNVAGDFFVDDSCIDCGACRWIAPDAFDGAGDHSRVYRQPTDADGTRRALLALVACPTGSIGSERKHDVRAAAAAYPVPIAGDVHHCGFHSADSFGAASYLIVRPGRGNVLVDSPRYNRGLVGRIEALGGVSLMFLTHRDDVADHQRFADHFGCERVLHRRDVSASTRMVEQQPDGDALVALDDELTMIPTPGHTRGSACLLYRDVLFSGDHVAYSRSMKRVYAFSGACWYDWATQIRSMERLLDHRFAHILPGHSAPCRFPAETMRVELTRCIAWMRAR